MKWARLEALSVDELALPSYRFEQMHRNDIAAVSECVRRWYPDISVGSASCFLDPQFYEKEVSLADEDETDLMVYVCRHEHEVVSMYSLERFQESKVIQGRLAVVSPAHRESGLSRFGPFIIDKQACAMGMAMAYNHVSLKNIHAQKLVERAGFSLVGIIPASDRELVELGIPKFVPEALYAKVYARSDELFVPSEECMTPTVRELWHRLFP
ncbi:hypothetical protein [Paraburkholderia caledonica]|uniref:hypothetical protein n=1 Tax=Paraburkholderia caledonica TaxID=134536 RepID=UPI00037346C6|nr:hypothetical protein [Paraburkholderia caledonica]